MPASDRFQNRQRLGFLRPGHVASGVQSQYTAADFRLGAQLPAEAVAAMNFSIVPDDHSSKSLIRAVAQHIRHAATTQGSTEYRAERSKLPWASLSLNFPNVRKQKPVKQQQLLKAHNGAVSFQASPSHALPARSNKAASAPHCPPNKRRRLPPADWHRAEFVLSAQPQQQSAFASLTNSVRHSNKHSKQTQLLSTRHTARQMCSSNSQRRFPVLHLADTFTSEPATAVDEEAEEVLLTRSQELGLTVKAKLRTWSRRMPNQLRRLVSGAVAGALSKTAIAPIETIRMQVMGGKGGVLESIGRTWARKGVLGFFSGNSADILRVMPSKAIELSAFDAYKKFLSHEDEQGKLKRPGPLLTALAGAAAGATATMGLYPLETLRTRLAMGDYDNMLHAVRLVTAEEGPWAFYQGLHASLIGILPYAAVRLGVYDGLKWSHRKYAKQDHIPALNTALYGAFAGLVSATATFPIEVVRRRMMVGTVKGSTWTALTTIARNEGWRSLYKGIGLTWAKQAPQYAVTFLAYDLLKEYLEVAQT